MEWVTKKELKEPKKIILECLNAIRTNLRLQGITFQHFLVGSAKRNLVLKNNNKGFDCDYQILLSKNKQGLNPKMIKDLFRKELDAVIKSHSFTNGEDSTLSITYKKIQKKSIMFGYDIVIIKKNNEEYEILKNEKKHTDDYHFIMMKELNNYEEKQRLIKRQGQWNILREIYKTKKVKNKLLKKEMRKESFQLFYDSLNEIVEKAGIMH